MYHFPEVYVFNIVFNIVYYIIQYMYFYISTILFYTFFSARTWTSSGM